jgi:hypothetical protein
VVFLIERWNAKDKIKGDASLYKKNDELKGTLPFIRKTIAPP